MSRSSNSPLIFRPCQHGAQVQRHHLLLLQRLGDIAGNDALGEPFHDRGLADPRLPDQHRIVLGTARQHLHHAADLVIAADNRVKFPTAGEIGKVARVALERLIFLFGIRIGDPLASTNRNQHLENVGAIDAAPAQQAPGKSLVSGQAEQQMLR